MLMSIPETCRQLSCGRTLTYDLMSAGELEAVKIGRRTLITKRSIEALIERGAAQAASLRKR